MRISLKSWDRHIVKFLRRKVVFILFLFIFFLAAFTTLGTTIVQQHSYNRRPVEGILPQIFPNEEIIEFRFYSYETEYRYPPINVDFRQKIDNNNLDLPVVNPHPFKYILKADHICHQAQNASLIIVVKSAAPHFELRNVLRNTWIPKAKGNNFAVVFALGYNKLVQQQVLQENAKNRDIIQEDFTDSYLNNTYKTIMSFNWVVEHCSHIEHVYFDDDDMFLHIDNLASYLKVQQNKTDKNLFSGSMAIKGKPVRNPSSKWYISWERYPFDYWPPYVGGSSMIAHMAIIKDMQKIFPYVLPLNFDDVYLGIILRKLHVKPTNNTHFDNTYLRNFDKLHSLIANHGFDDPRLYNSTFYKIFPEV